ncbi:MAG: DUF4336 domain-containing protein [Polyangiales bacterium]
MGLTERAKDVWTADAPLKLMGMHIGTRMSVVRLPDASLLVHSPIELTPALKAEVDALGEVAHIVCPNTYHHLHAGPWKQAYPKARLQGPPGLHSKRSDLRFDGPLPSGSWNGFELVPIHGSMLEETVFVHPATKTVISSDLTENFVAPVDHWLTRTYLKVNGTYDKIGWPKVLRMVYRDKKAARRSVDQLLEHDFDRVVVAHGQVIESAGKEALRSTFEFLG